MSIASIRQAREAKYQRISFGTAVQAQWAHETYYDMESILAGERDVHFNFDQTTPLELFPAINQPRQTEIPPRGVNLPVKMWQLPVLRYCGNPIVPGDYKPASIESIRVGAKVAKLTERKDMFYEKGCLISRFLQPNEAKRVSNDLLNTLLYRSKYIFLRTLDLQSTSNLRFSRLEMSIYDQGRYTEQRLCNWHKSIPRRKQDCQRNFRRYT